MSPPKNAPYGSWLSPLKAEALAASAVTLGSLQTAGERVFWLESRPLEKGRNVLVQRAPDGSTAEALPPDNNVRTTVHEYGGGAYFIQAETVFFSNFADQRLYRASVLDGSAAPITPEPEQPWGWRYADGRALAGDLSNQIVCVRETHHPGTEAVNELLRLPMDGSHPPQAIASGHDFYSDPRPSPDGRQLAWLCWDHPNMPWDGSELWLGDLTPEGDLINTRRLAGGPDESISQPRWSPQGELYFISDRSGWWNLYRWTETGAQPVSPLEAEFCGPQWVFGLSSYLFLPDGQIATIYSQDGIDRLGLIPAAGGVVTPVEIGLTVLSSLAWDGTRLWLIAAGPTTPAAVVAFDLSNGTLESVRASTSLALDPAYVSIPWAIEFPTQNGLTAHAFY